MILLDRIENARHLLRGGRLANEAAVSSGVVLPLLDALGWPVFDPNVVAPEYNVEGRRVDFALLYHKRPLVFVEVKQPGLSNGADRQLFEYAFHTGVPIALLTDGATWHFYLPAEQGSYLERRVYLLDLLERDPAESVERLRRYLDYGSVISGEAIERARHDYQRARQRREAKESVPRAWAQLVQQQDSELVAFLVAEVESLSGYKPDPADVLSYLRGLGGSTEVPAAEPPRRRVPSRPAATPRASGSSASRGVTFEGTFYPCKTGREVLARTFELLADRDPSFLTRFASLPKHGRTRRYLARTPQELYPSRPDLQKFALEVRPGWWLSTNQSHASMLKVIGMACEVAGLQLGQDLQARFE